MDLGGKVAHFERIEWKVIPDSATAAAALQNGEVDWYEQVQADLVPLLKNNAASSSGRRTRRAMSAGCASTTCIRRSTMSCCAARC